MGFETNISSYYDCIGDLIMNETVQSMKNTRHHFWSTCYDHSVFVSYVAFCLARHLGADCAAAARAGLLHDLYLYDPRDKSCYEGNQCFAHPKAALKNAIALCGDITPQEANSIISHMWPLASSMPKCREAVLVNLADKFCATVEVFNLYPLFCRRHKVPVPV